MSFFLCNRFSTGRHVDTDPTQIALRCLNPRGPGRYRTWGSGYVYGCLCREDFPPGVFSATPDVRTHLFQAETRGVWSGSTPASARAPAVTSETAIEKSSGINPKLELNRIS